MITLELVVEDGRWSDALPDAEGLFARAAEAAAAVHGPVEATAEIGVRLDADEGVRALNRAWRGKDRPTNVLSFPAGGGPHPQESHHLGDIVLAYETVEAEAESEGKSLADHAAHLLVHGVLHLLGHHHEEENEGDAMEALEVEALGRLGIADPYQDRAG